MTGRPPDARALREHVGTTLRRHREAAGLTQRALARRVGYSRSTIANAERCDLRAAEVYERCDRALHARGEIAAAYRAALAARGTRPRRVAPAHLSGPAVTAPAPVESLRLHWSMLVRRYERQA